MNAKWISASPVHGETALYIFKKTFRLEKEAKAFSVRISADTAYRLFINGREISQGPCIGSFFYKHFEDVSCAEAAVVGENEILVQVVYATTTQHFSSSPREGAPALYFEGRIETEDGRTEIASDESFSVFRVKNHRFVNRGEILPGVAPFEIVEGDAEYEPLSTNVLYLPKHALHYISRGGVKEKYPLKPRWIPALALREKKPMRVVKEYEDAQGSLNLILDPGRYTTDNLRFEYEAEKGTEIRIYYAECALMRGADGTLFKGVRDDIENGEVASDAFDLLIASGKEQIFEPFRFRVFRFIRVCFSKKPRDFRAFSARYTYDYDANATNGGVGSFECSDERFNRMWQISKNTLECVSHDTLVDCPFYEQAQYVGDGYYSSLYAWRFSNDSQMQKKLLTETAHSQQEDGQVLTTYPNSRDRHQILHQSNTYFIHLMREYLRYTGDTDFVHSMTGVCDRILGFFEGTLDENGLVKPTYGWRFLDWIKEWENGVPDGGTEAPMTVYSLFYAAALKDMAEVCEACGRHGLASEYRERYAEMIARVRALCYNEEKGLYVDVLGYEEYSEHPTFWAILAGACEGEAARDLIERTLTTEGVKRCGFPKNLFMLRAMEKAGCYEEFAPQILSRWYGMLENHSTTWCEDPVFQRSECHGWGSVPAYEFSAMVLGVYPIENGFQRVRIKPTPLHLSFANGRVPTPFGYIDVAWRREGETFHIEVEASKPLDMEIVLPSGEAFYVFSDRYCV